MPLKLGESQKAFDSNVRREMEHDKSQKQSLAIAYAMKRKAQKHNMAHGGEAYCAEGCAMPHEHKYADGGFVHEEEASGYMPHEGDMVKHNEMAMHEDDRMLGQHGEMEVGPEGHMPGEKEEGYAHGGFIGSHQGPEHEEDMVGRIMKKREHMYSEGGKVANSDEIKAGFMPNEFDDLHLRDDLNFKYNGSNSGDELGNKYDADHDDMVSRIMMKRHKQHNPRPA